MKLRDNLYESESLESREIRMVRISKYLISLYDTKKFSPFTQFAKYSQIKDIRDQITSRVTKFTQLLKKSDNKESYPTSKKKTPMRRCSKSHLVTCQILLNWSLHFQIVWSKRKRILVSRCRLTSQISFRKLAQCPILNKTRTTGHLEHSFQYSRS